MKYRVRKKATFNPISWAKENPGTAIALVSVAAFGAYLLWKKWKAKKDKTASMKADYAAFAASPGAPRVLPAPGTPAADRLIAATQKPASGLTFTNDQTPYPARTGVGCPPASCPGDTPGSIDPTGDASPY